VLVWTNWAWVSAGLWVPASLLSFLCVRDLGIALGQGIWAGCVALVSFLWGQLYFHSHMSQPLYGSVGIVVLVLGIAALGIISGGGCGGQVRTDEEERQLRDSMSGASTDSGSSSPLKQALNPVVADSELGGSNEHLDSPERKPKRNTARGLLLALGVGLGAGSTMAPLRLAADDGPPFNCQGFTPLIFAVCFGVCAVGVAAAIAAGTFAWLSALSAVRRPPAPPFARASAPSLCLGFHLTCPVCFPPTGAQSILAHGSAWDMVPLRRSSALASSPRCSQASSGQSATSAAPSQCRSHSA
jgi:hypothetical protein